MIREVRMCDMPTCEVLATTVCAVCACDICGNHSCRLVSKGDIELRHDGAGAQTMQLINCATHCTLCSACRNQLTKTTIVKDLRAAIVEPAFQALFATWPDVVRQVFARQALADNSEKK